MYLGYEVVLSIAVFITCMLCLRHSAKYFYALFHLFLRQSVLSSFFRNSFEI